MSDPRCKCTFSQSMTGDGCRYCQPQECIDRMGEWLDEERAELNQARQIITDLVKYAECNDPGNPHIGRAKGFLSGGDQ